MEFVLFVWFASAIVCWIIANNKARMAGGWFVLGLMLGPLTVVAVSVLPTLETDTSAATPKTHIKCPDCRELVITEAKVCKHCQCRLVPRLT